MYLVRHGETIWNREGRLQGQLDSELTPLGRLQVRNVGRKLRELIGPRNGYKMISSPLGRAQASASIIRDEQGRDVGEIATDDRLKEISWGVWEGLTREEIEARFPGELARRRRNRWKFVPPGGESYEMLAARVEEWLGEISQDRRLVVVGHGGMGRVTRGLYVKLPIRKILTLDRPQDAIFRLHMGEIARIEVGGSV